MNSIRSFVLYMQLFPSFIAKNVVIQYTCLFMGLWPAKKENE